MKIRTEFPHAVREMENIWIPMSDGTRLGARIWLPAHADEAPVPAILEYIPYRKDDHTAPRDMTRHPYFAGHGYASIRVDMRGSGASDGILLDEYLPQEQDDALEVLAWLAAQPWSTGAVGMMGISWGGFNALQVAARRPPELRGIITVCSTDDRYNDDCHYNGGCVLGSDLLSWASHMLVFNARPPDPRIVGECWRDMWFERMANTPPFIEAWLSHQRLDGFWRQGSVCQDYTAIACPVYAVGGWADPYRNAVLRLLAHLTVPRKGLIGPWAHSYPHAGVPGPAIGFLQECLRWWDWCLKGIDTGIIDEPMLRAWMPESVEPRTYYETRPGRWVAEPTWPRPDARPRVYAFNDRALEDGAGAEVVLQYQGVQHAGLDGGVWCPGGTLAELPGPQRTDDGLSMTFDTAPLKAPMEILGFPEITVTVAVDQPEALLAVRLCDIAPTGASTFLTWGLLNLTHRDSHEVPTPLEPGKRYTVTVRLNAIAHSLPVGHRWRIAISPTYWPHAWPSSKPVTLSVFTGGESQLRLPVRESLPEDMTLAPFDEPECSPPPDMETLATGERARTVEIDVVRGVYRLRDAESSGCARFVSNGVEMADSSENVYTIVEGDPLSATVRCNRVASIGRGDWRTRVETTSVMSADAGAFHVTNLLEAYEGETRVFTKTWHLNVPRILV